MVGPCLPIWWKMPDRTGQRVEPHLHADHGLAPVRRPLRWRMTDKLPARAKRHRLHRCRRTPAPFWMLDLPNQSSVAECSALDPGSSNNRI